MANYPYISLSLSLSHTHTHTRTNQLLIILTFFILSHALVPQELNQLKALQVFDARGNQLKRYNSYYVRDSLDIIFF